MVFFNEGFPYGKSAAFSNIFLILWRECYPWLAPRAGGQRQSRFCTFHYYGHNFLIAIFALILPFSFIFLPVSDCFACIFLSDENFQEAPVC